MLANYNFRLVTKEENVDIRSTTVYKVHVEATNPYYGELFQAVVIVKANEFGIFPNTIFIKQHAPLEIQTELVFESWGQSPASLMC